ncbi:MAG: acyltransferase, partial [Dongia sp.]
MSAVSSISQHHPAEPASRGSPYSFAADKRYIPALDGMRALSIAVVVASHFWVNGPVPGGFGVTVFFFISGFLITRLLLAEFNADGHISIGRFYVRRFLRLYPALFVLIVGLSALYFAMYGQVDFLEMIAALFYFMNYYVLVHPDVQMPIRMLWSLAIEEHYYFIFPLLF